MKKYVEAFKLMEKLEEMKNAVGSCREVTDYDLGIRLGITKSIVFVKSTPAANVSPVCHGTWIQYAGGLLKCSVCGHEYIDYIECDAFCGNCGARMDA